MKALSAKCNLQTVFNMYWMMHYIDVEILLAYLVLVTFDLKCACLKGPNHQRYHSLMIVSFTINCAWVWKEVLSMSRWRKKAKAHIVVTAKLKQKVCRNQPSSNKKNRRWLGNFILRCSLWQSPQTTKILRSSAATSSNYHKPNLEREWHNHQVVIPFMV